MRKISRKLLAVLLSITIVLSCAPITTFAAGNKISNSDDIVDNTQIEEATIVSEITEKREEDKKVFLLSDGTYMAVAYGQPVHYENNGEWQDYDNTLIETEAEDSDSDKVKNKDLINKSSDLTVRLSQKTNQKKFVQIEKDGYKISWYFLNANKVEAKIKEIVDSEDMTHLSKVSSIIEYKNVYENTDFSYILNSNQVKENIILNDNTAPCEFEIEYKANKLTPVLTDEQTISLYNEENESIYTISAPYMIDSLGNTNDDINFEITKIQNGKFTVKLKLNSNWLDDDERAYPITVDPLIQSSQDWEDETNCHSAFISSSNPTLCYGRGGNHYEGSLYVGKDISYGQTRALIKNPTLPPLGIADKVVHAEMAVYVRVCYPELRMDLYRVKENWEQNSVTWEERPDYDDTTIIDYQIVQHIETEAENADRWQRFEITDLVRGWYSGEIPNYGVLLRSDAETSSSQARAWLYSSGFPKNIALRPVLTVVYRHMSGYEDYWSYTELASGRNGKVSVNNYNGNLVYTQPLTADNGGNLMPVNISLIYNSNGISTQFVGNNTAGYSYMASKMQTNYHMYVREDSTTATNGYRYFFHDGDGTRHWFYFESATATSGKDEDGLGYTLDLIAANSDSSCSSARYRIKDKNNTRLYFNDLGNLIQITNANNVSSTVQYETVSGYLRIKSITDGAGRVYTFTYHPSYAYLVCGIIDPAGKQTSFEYWSGLLTRVIFPDNNYYYISYSDGLAVSFGSIDGTKTTVSYDTSSQHRVTEVSWGTTENDVLEKYTFLYKQNETTVTDKQNRGYTYQFNDYAQTTGVISKVDGIAQFFEWGNGDSTATTANKLLSQSRAIKSVANYVINPDFYDAYSEGYWTYAPDTTGSPTISIDTTKGNLTKNSLKVYKPSSNTKNVTAVQNFTSVSAGTYTLSAYVNTNGATLGGEGAYLGVEFRNSSGTLTTVQYAEKVKKTDSWERISLTFALPAAHTLTFVAGFDCYGNNSYGTVWFDDIQLEKGTGISSYNLIENSGFNNGKEGWPTSTYLAATDLGGFNQAVYRAGDPTNQWLGISQHVQTVPGKKGDVFSFGAWVKVDSAPVDNGTKTADAYAPHCRLVLHFYDNNGVWNYEKKISVNTDVTSWQFLSGEAIAPVDYSKVCLELIYFYNVNTFGMVGAFCFKEEFGQTYTYDDNGNVVSSVDVSNSESTFSYKNNQLTQMLNPSGSKYFYSYAYNESDLAEAVSTDGQQYSFTYDTSGNMLTATVEKDKPVTNFQTGVAYIIRNVKTGNVLDRGNVDKSAYNWRYRKGNLYQQWKLEATGEADVYYLKCCAPWDNEKYLYVKDSANTDNADLKVSVSANSDAHKFKLHANGDGTFRILTKASNYTKCLDSLPGSSIDTGDGSNLKQYTRISEDKAQHWLFYPDITGSNPVDATAEKIITSAQYTDNKNFLSSVSDAAGNETYYNYESNTGNLLSTTDAKGNITSYTYDQNTDNLLSVAAGETVNSYTYSKDRLDKISTTNGTSYKFIYDGFGRTTAIQRGNGTAYSTLSSMEYNSAGLLSKQTYGNGNYVNFYYDSLDRLTEKVYNGDSSKKIAYYYGSDGRVSYCMDYMANTTTRYVYDLAGRVVKLKVYNGTTFRCLELKESITYNYANKTNYVTSVTYTSSLGTQTVNYGYGSLATETMPDTVYSVSQNGTEQIKYSFDDLARLSSRNISPINKTQTYTYKQGGHGTNSTTTQVASVTADGVTTSYTYDALGNITAIHKNGTLYESYEYDSLNQLTKVTTASGDVYEYTYSGGNITSVKLNGTILKTYSYDNSEWADLLTGYNGDTITYDNIGNPLNYRDSMTFNWQNGRQLAGITKGTDSIAYTYNAEGLRISKTVNGTATNYTYIDGRLIGETTGNNTIIYLYDDNGSKYGFTYNGTAYYYNLNLQGDVIGIYDASGNIVVEYTYDVWGKLSSVTGELASTIGQINPIRYRGYYYDGETGLYYVSSRYYDPEIGRWINADSVIDQSSVLGYNLFAYCRNNPVNMTDTTGNLPFFAITAAIGAVVGAVVGGVVAAKNGGNVWAGIGIGAAAGGLIGAGAGAAAGALLAGSAAASTTSVVIGAKAVVSVVGSAGFSAGVKMLADNASQACSNVSQVFWSGGDVAKNAAKQVANEIGGKTLEMTRVGSYLEQINAPYSAWQAASSNFANVASNSSSAIYSIQNASGVGIQSIWATIEYPLLQGKDIIYGVVSQSGLIQIMP